ncbi:MAG TPA: hypothetical protein VHG33_00070 [Woeseiaceae bacterium]|nr:hypothetical protein [Woeseiaceae bacterium]
MFQLIELKGDDAASFLQGQLTQDVQKLPDAGALLGAWCNPKGRVICVTRMLALDGSFGLVLPSELVDTVLKRLLMYRLRSRVDITAAPDWQSTAVATETDLEALRTRELLPKGARGACRRAHGITAIEVGSPERCIELHGRRTAINGLELAMPLPDANWRKALVDAGIPTIDAATSERYTPHMLNLDLLGAVSFDKGCYTGQEIVARTQHRGQTKRRLCHYRLEEGEPAVGDRLTHEGREVGEVVNTAGADFLAVAPVELHERNLEVNGQRASPVPLPYAACP